MNEELISTDEAILDSIGEGDDQQTTDEGTSGEDTGATTDSDKETPTAGSEQGTEGGDGKDAPEKTSGGPQDLVDAQGNVVATGGKERRFYETAQREKARADTATKEVSTLQAQIEAINSAGTLSTQYDLTPEEMTTGAQIISSYKQNPVETIQYMLTQAQAAGHNIDAIGGGGLDMKAVKQMMDTALQPLLTEQTERVDTQEANNRALEIYNEFSAKYPDAAPHEDSLARLLQQESTLSPEAAYFKLRSYYHERGLDWTKSLEQLQSQVQPSSVNTQQAVPDGNVTDTRVTDTAQVADANTSTSDIIRQAMEDAGIT